MDTLLRDLRFGARVFLRDRGFAAVAVVTLALAIGGTVTLYSVIDALLLRGLPVQEPGRVVRVHAAAPRTGALGSLSYPDARDYSGSPVFTATAIHRVTGVSVSSAARPERATAELVSGQYFTLLGTQAAQGRLLGSGDDRAPLQHPVVVLADGFWRRYLGATTDVVGRPLRINGHLFTIVGVAPPGFRGATDLVVPDLWVPLQMQGWVMPRVVNLLESRDTAAFDLVGRLGSPVSMTQAEAALQTVSADLDRAYPRSGVAGPEPRTARVVRASSVPTNLRAPVTAFTGLLAATVLVVLGLTALNLANLLLARATTRAHEMSLRHALGAGRSALLRQMLTEQVLLACVGGLAGLGLTLLLQRLLSSIPVPTPVPVSMPLRLDLRVLAAALGISTLTGVLVGLLPALRASRAASAPALRGAAEGGRLGLRRVLLGAQIAGSLALLTVSGLLATSLRHVTSVDPGFDASRVAIAAMNVGLQGYAEPLGAQFYESLQDRLLRTPGIERASFGWTVPMGSAALSYPVIGGSTAADGQSLPADYNFVASDYFDALGIPLTSGRAIDRTDTASSNQVAVINDALAARLWPGQSPLGRRLRLVAREGRRDGAALGLSVPQDLDLEVVGVVANVALRVLGEAARPAFYLPFTQWYQTERTLHVRAPNPGAALSAVRAAVTAMDADLPLFNVKTMDEHLASSLFPARAASLTVGAFGLLTLVLATIGLYGLVSFSVRSRTREIAVRIAVGGSANDIVRLIVLEGMRPVVWGLVIGAGMAVAAARAARPFLFGASVADPTAWILAVSALLLAAGVGAFVPARRASTLAPAPILRQSE